MLCALVYVSECVLPGSRGLVVEQDVLCCVQAK